MKRNRSTHYDICKKLTNQGFISKRKNFNEKLKLEISRFIIRESSEKFTF